MDFLLRLRLLLPSTGHVWGIFVFHDAFGPEFVLMHHFPSRQEVDCVSWWWTQPGREGCLGALTHKTGRNSFFRNQMFWFSSCNIFSFQIVTTAAATWSFRWKLLLYLWPSHKLTKPVQYPQCIGKVRSISNPFSPNKMLSDPPTPKKIGNCYIIRSAWSRSGSEFSFCCLLKESWWFSVFLDCKDWLENVGCWAHFNTVLVFSWGLGSLFGDLKLKILIPGSCMFVSV